MDDNIINRLKNSMDTPNKIISRKKYFNAAVLVPIINIDNTYHFVFEKRAKNITQGSEISFPGGGYEEKDKSFLETAIRETEEELGIHRNKIKVIKNFGTYVGRQGVIVEVFIGELIIQTIQALKPQQSEVEKVFTVPVDYFIKNKPKKYPVRLEQQPYFMDEMGNKVELLPSKELGLPIKYHHPWSTKLIELNFFKVENEMIWGLTAEILCEIIEPLNNESHKE
ncbi:NUDIX domain-containing protein [Natranaerovirga hydrolytica]|uniref:NUDIX domain-containing protein n=1 Tax=Natranaerovirga hydrolytica TaxID=680378 RepID=A0A4R1MBU2_9FIRM|nr:CoA pyrophosphatase [Natranaerovirga hydrolytica]TCK89022.1 NUDIX domain-containing protein [Natranaerovirga hydrolytica]